MKKPYLREFPAKPDLSDYPEGTCWEAGFLTTKNSGFRIKRPVIQYEKCTYCQQCYLYCPDGAIIRELDKKALSIDYDFCKGCGICSKICKFKAIRMEDEES